MFNMSTASLHTSWQTTTPLTNRCCDVTMMSSLDTALPSKQEKYLPTCVLGARSIAMEHAKNYEIRCKIIWNIQGGSKKSKPLYCNNSLLFWATLYKQNEWHLFSGQCNVRFLSTKVLQGSVGTCENYGRIFINYFTANLLQSVTVKAFWKSVRISRSYRQK